MGGERRKSHSVCRNRAATQFLVDLLFDLLGTGHSPEEHCGLFFFVCKDASVGEIGSIV